MIKITAHEDVQANDTVLLSVHLQFADLHFPSPGLCMMWRCLRSSVRPRYRKVSLMLNGNFLESRLTFFDSEIVLAN